jgi:GrpB-like predicted nucleotidyltransferase (UPF0157 family)
MEKYKFRPYNKNFPLLYKRESAKLKKLLPRVAKVEHVGSTAVKGLRGKGLIDIVIAVPKKSIFSVKNLLEKGGYEFRPGAGDKDRLFFRRDYPSRGKERRVHLHLTFFNSKDFIEMIAVRNYLRVYKSESKKYECVKRKAVKKAEGQGKIYRKLKDRYLKQLTKRATKASRKN